jgi:hypothetical protein
MRLIKNVDSVGLILMILEFLFGLSLLYSMTAENAVTHLFFSGLSIGMALMHVPNIIHSLSKEAI